MRRDGNDFSASFTDMMSGLAAIFLLVALLFIVLSTSAQSAVRRQAEEFTELKARDSAARRTAGDLEAALRTLFPAARSGVRVLRDADRNPLLILVLFSSDRRDGEGLFFDPGRAELGPEARRLIADRFPDVFRALCPVRDRLESVVLEGHTDTVANFHGRAGRAEGCDLERRHVDPRCKIASFNNNVVLSADRAQNVFFFARQTFLAAGDEALVRCLEESFTVAGRGEVDPFLPPGRAPVPPGHPDPESRRVVLKIKVKPASPTEVE